MRNHPRIKTTNTRMWAGIREFVVTFEDGFFRQESKPLLEVSKQAVESAVEKGASKGMKVLE